MDSTSRAPKAFATSVDVVQQSHPFVKGARILHIRPVGSNGRFASFTDPVKELLKNVRSNGSYFTWNAAAKCYSAEATDELVLWAERLAKAVEEKAKANPEAVEAAPAPTKGNIADMTAALAAI